MAGKLLHWFQNFWQRLPLVGYLVYCTRKNHAEAMRELFVTLLFSTTTFWISALILQAFMQNAGMNYFAIIKTTANAGQLFIFAVSFMGPVFLLAGDDPPKAKNFPNRGLHFIVLFVLAIIASCFYALQLGAKQFPGSMMLDSHFLMNTSMVIAALAIALRYLTVVYRKNTLYFDPNVEMVERTTEFADQFARRHSA
ncbi:MAG: hypothetical protein K0S73_1098 [Stenotrophomonas rhizophila]|nr:hypothetical protein [Stenotrophomonas rhizophila]